MRNLTLYFHHDPKMTDDTDGASSVQSEVIISLQMQNKWQF